MDDNEVANFLRDFSLWPRFFTFNEIIEFLDPDICQDTFRQALVNDERFIILDKDMSDECLIISEKTLFSWFIYLILRLAKAHQPRITGHQLAIRLSFLRHDGQWKYPPSEVINFGLHLGLITPALKPDLYFLPLAWLISFFTKQGMITASLVLEEFGLKEDREKALLKPNEYWLEEGFAIFERTKSIKKITNIIRRREGFLTGVQETLEQIGDELGLTRERVRQIEGKFWGKVLKFPKYHGPFMQGLFLEVMRKKGSLIINNDDLVILFLAKCLGLTTAEFANSGLAIIGALQENVDSIGLIWQWHELINAVFIASQVESENLLYLSADDVHFVSDKLAIFNREHLNKSQRVYLVLRAIGSPAHYSMVAEEYNRMFPKSSSNEHNIHAVLARGQYGIVWLGAKGIYALEEWGYKTPRPLFDTVKEIVIEKYSKTGQSVPFKYILAEIGKYRPFVSLNSLFMALTFHPDLKRISKDSFIPKDTEDKKTQEISDEELDRILQEFEERR